MTLQRPEMCISFEEDAIYDNQITSSRFYQIRVSNYLTSNTPHPPTPVTK